MINEPNNNNNKRINHPNYDKNDYDERPERK